MCACRWRLRWTAACTHAGMHKSNRHCDTGIVLSLCGCRWWLGWTAGCTHRGVCSDNSGATASTLSYACALRACGVVSACACRWWLRWRAGRTLTSVHNLHRQSNPMLCCYCVVAGGGCAGELGAAHQGGSAARSRGRAGPCRQRPGEFCCRHGLLRACKK